MKPILVLVTVPTLAVGRKLGKRLVEAKLAACVNIVPGLTSIYRWQGKVETGKELLLLIKSAEGKWKALEAAIRANHPYECPEIVAVPPSRMAKAYGAWWRGALNVE